MKKFWKLVNNRRNYRQKLSGTLFMAHPVKVEVSVTRMSEINVESLCRTWWCRRFIRTQPRWRPTVWMWNEFKCGSGGGGAENEGHENDEPSVSVILMLCHLIRLVHVLQFCVRHFQPIRYSSFPLLCKRQLLLPRRCYAPKLPLSPMYFKQ